MRDSPRINRGRETEVIIRATRRGKGADITYEDSEGIPLTSEDRKRIPKIYNQYVETALKNLPDLTEVTLEVRRR